MGACRCALLAAPPAALAPPHGSSLAPEQVVSRHGDRQAADACFAHGLPIARLAFSRAALLGHDQERLAGLNHRFEDGQERLE